MVKNCCVESCHTVWNPYRAISLFSFPWNNEQLMEEWRKVIPTKCKITKHSRVCSLHFTEEAVEQKSLKKCLKKDAIPTIFDGKNTSTLRISNDVKPFAVLNQNDLNTASCACEVQYPESRSSSPVREVKMKDVSTQMSPRRLQASDKEEALRRKIKILQGRLRRRESKLSTMTQLIRELEKSDQIEFEEKVQSDNDSEESEDF